MCENISIKAAVTRWNFKLKHMCSDVAKHVSAGACTKTIEHRNTPEHRNAPEYRIKIDGVVLFSYYRSRKK